MAWNLPPVKEIISDVLDDSTTQDLLLSSYIEEQDRWNKSMLAIESELLNINKEVRELKAKKESKFDVIRFKLFGRVSNRQKRIDDLQKRARELDLIYMNLVENMPKTIDAYEFAMYGRKMFKPKT